MQKYNKAYAGGIGAAVAMIAVWLIEAAGLAVPGEVQTALTIVLSGLGPMLAPANK